jgi:hypothetical protein
MKKAIITFIILFCISLFTTIVSAVVCGGELIKTGIEYGVGQYREYKAEQHEMNNINDMIETA